MKEKLGPVIGFGCSGVVVPTIERKNTRSIIINLRASCDYMLWGVLTGWKESKKLTTNLLETSQEPEERRDHQSIAPRTIEGLTSPGSIG
jgi:hypothetical protein